MADENLYFKEGRRYVPVGRRVNLDYLHDGVWYVHHHGAVSVSMANADYLVGVYRICGAKDLSLDVLAGMENIVDGVLKSKELQQLISNGYSAADLVRLAVAQIVAKYSKSKEGPK